MKTFLMLGVLLFAADNLSLPIPLGAKAGQGEGPLPAALLNAVAESGAAQKADAAPIALVDAALANGPGPYRSGQSVVSFKYGLENVSGKDIAIPLDASIPRVFHVLGVQQNWVERLGSDATIPTEETSGRRGRQYGAGGRIVTTEPEFRGRATIRSKEQVQQLADGVLPAGLLLSFSSDLNITDWPSGEYEYTIEYTAKRGGVTETAQAKKIRFTIESTTAGRAADATPTEDTYRSVRIVDLHLDDKSVLSRALTKSVSVRYGLKNTSDADIRPIGRSLGDRTEWIGRNDNAITALANSGRFTNHRIKSFVILLTPGWAPEYRKTSQANATPMDEQQLSLISDGVLPAGATLPFQSEIDTTGWPGGNYIFRIVYSQLPAHGGRVIQAESIAFNLP